MAEIGNCFQFCNHIASQFETELINKNTNQTCSPLKTDSLSL